MDHPLAHHQLVFVDTETGGLSATRHDIVEIACRVTDITSRTLITEYSRKLLPTLPVDPGAAAVNGYDANIWAAQAVPADQAIAELRALIDGHPTILVGHNLIGFDWKFISRLAQRHGWRHQSITRLVDTLQMAKSSGLFANNKQTTIAAHYGIDTGTAHRALDDTRTLHSLYQRLRGDGVKAMGAAPSAWWLEAEMAVA